MEIDFKSYRRSGITEMRPYVAGEDMSSVSVGQDAAKDGSPKEGDWIARDPHNHADQWLVPAAFFEKQKFVEVTP